MAIVVVLSLQNVLWLGKITLASDKAIPPAEVDKAIIAAAKQGRDLAMEVLLKERADEPNIADAKPVKPTLN